RFDGWISSKSLVSRLKAHLGVVYRHTLPAPKMLVDDEPVQAADPLFLMEHGRFHAENSFRAQRIDTKACELETPSGRRGHVRIRASFLPVNFHLADRKAPRVTGRSKKGRNDRFDIMHDYNGILICRAGRQIDCIPPRWTKFQNNDIHIKIEVD